MHLIILNYICIIYFLFQNIEKEIKEHLKGDAVLIYYKNNGILNGEARGILVEISASCMIKIIIKYVFYYTMLNYYGCLVKLIFS